MYNAKYELQAIDEAEAKAKGITVDEYRARQDDWRAQAVEQEKQHQARIAEAKRNRVYLAMGPIIGGVLLANLITAVFCALLYELLK
jgi:hypothetical protein